jgi:hypothetical protein
MRKLDLKGNIGDRSIQIYVYAGDVIIIARSEQAVNETFHKLKEEVQSLGSLININEKLSSLSCCLSV